MPIWGIRSRHQEYFLGTTWIVSRLSAEIRHFNEYLDFRAKIAMNHYLKSHIGKHCDIKRKWATAHMSEVGQQYANKINYGLAQDRRTWVSNDGQTGNQIDHILADAKAADTKSDE